MRIIQSPKNLTSFTKDDFLFLAGGISNCPDWQSDICERFKEYKGNLTIFNPRRIGDLAKDNDEARKQILWEHHYLNESFNILFWFPEETVCPITLFELGKYAQHFKNMYTYPEDFLFLGIHPNYSRKFDLEIQIPLMIPKIEIQYSLDDLFEHTVKKLRLKK